MAHAQSNPPAGIVRVDCAIAIIWFASGGLVWRREGVACSDACSYQACAFLATAVGALLVLRRVTRACSLFSCCVLALHRREAPLRSAGSPAHGPAPHAANNRNAGKWSAFMCSHIPKIGGIAPVTLRYSDHECRRSVLNLRLWNCFFPVLRTLTWRSTDGHCSKRQLLSKQPGAC